MKHLLSIEQLSRDEIFSILRATAGFKAALQRSAKKSGGTPPKNSAHVSKNMISTSSPS